MNPKRILVSLALISVLVNLFAYAYSAKETSGRSTVKSLGAKPIFQNSIQVGNNDTYTMQNGHFVLNDTVNVKENATLIIRNAVLDFNMSSSTAFYINDNATVSISNATISHIWGYFYASFHGRTSLAVSNTSLIGNSYFYFYDTSNVSMKNSEGYSFYAENNATVALIDTSAQYFYCYQFTRISIIHCLIGYLKVYDSSSVLVADSSISDSITLDFVGNSSISLSFPTGNVDLWNLYNNNIVTKAYLNLTIVSTSISLWTVYCYATSVVSIADSSLDTVGAYENSTVSLSNCTVSSLDSQNYCNIRLIDSTVTSNVRLLFLSGSILGLTLPQGHFTHWNLYQDNTVTSAFLNLTLQNSNVTSWNVDAYNSKISLIDSYIGYLNVYDNSTVSASNSTFNGLYCYTFSSTDLASATVNYAYVEDVSTMSAADSGFGSLYAYGNSSISLGRVQLNYLGIYDSSSVLISDSLINNYISLSFTADSKVSFFSLPNGNVKHWNLYEDATITKAYLNLTMINTKLRGWGEFDAYKNSTISIHNSIISYLYAYELSQVTIINSLADYVYVYDNSSLSLTNSSIQSIQLNFKSDSDVTFASLPKGWVDYWSLYDNASVLKAYISFTASRTWIKQWSFTTSDSAALSFMFCPLSYVTAYDSSEISMNNCTMDGFGAYERTTVSLYRSVVRYSSYVYDYATLTLTDSNIQSNLYVKFIDAVISDLSLPTGLISSWNLYEDAVVERAYFNLTISNTTIKGWGFYIYGFSTVSLRSTHLYYISENDFSTVSMENCTADTIYAYKLSRLLTTSVPMGESIITNLYTYGMSNATLVESKVAIIGAYQYSTLNLVGSDYVVVWAYDHARVQISWFLEVQVTDRGNQNVPFADVTVTDGVGGLVALTQADGDGMAHFTLIEKVVDAQGSHPAGNCNVIGSYSGYTANKTLLITGNEQVTINIPFTVPEFSYALIFPLLLILLVAFGIALRKLKRSDKAQMNPN